jgi:7-cyano-7-deazaguanine synthase
MSEKPQAVVLMSGGMDSCVTAAIAARNHDIAALHATYGQRTSLTDRRLPVLDADLTNKEIPNTYVPFRNAHFLAIATSWAESMGASRIFIGAVCEDSSGYPDCRPEYYTAMNALIRAGTRPETKITVETPLISLMKREIVKQGSELGAPFHLTWSCYRETEAACGICDSCALRLRAFQEAGVEDPIAYRTRPEYTRSVK